MLFSWLKKNQRRRLLAEPCPQVWTDILKQNVVHYGRLTTNEQKKLCDDMRILIDEKNWEGCDGLTLTDEMRVTIAAQAALLLLGFEGKYFEMVQSILVYPRSYVRQGQTVLEGGVVIEGESHREGEAGYRGPVIVSWEDALSNGRGHDWGHNLVLHEFAHQLDMENGRIVDGIPPLENPKQSAHWQQVIGREYSQLDHDCRFGRPTLLDCYGATHIAEFFAVCTETFFERPVEMSRHHSELYVIFREFYRQDPGQRLSR